MLTEVSEVSSGYATESVNEFFKLSYFNLFESILGYVNSLAFFPVLLYRQTDYFCYLEWLYPIELWRKKNNSVRTYLKGTNIRGKKISQILRFSEIGYPRN